MTIISGMAYCWKTALLGPQPGVGVAAVGQVENDEAAEIKGVIEIAPFVQADEKHRVIGNQRQQETVRRAAARSRAAA